MDSTAHAGSDRDMAYYDAHWRNDPGPGDGTLLSKIKSHIRQFYERVKSARANLHQKLSDYGKNLMNKLFGTKDGELSPAKLAAIDRRFAATENKLKKMADNEGADIRFFGPSQFGEETPFEGATTRYGDRSGLPEIGVSRATPSSPTTKPCSRC